MIFPACLIAFMSLSGVALELAFAHCLAGLFGNTFLRYSLTMGLFLMSSGVGSVYFEKVRHVPPRPLLAAIEIALALVATLSLPLIIFLATLEPTLAAVCAYTFMIIIGFLTGLELPLVLNLKQRASSLFESAVLYFDFIGSGLGGILFGVLLFPYLGLFNSVFALALVNALLGVALSWRLPGWKWLGLASFAVAATACIFSDPLTATLVNLYDRAIY